MTREIRHVLMIEDCQIAQKVGKFVFGKLDCVLDIANSGQAGIEMAQNNHYSLLVVDVGLPDMSGIETIERLLKTNAKYKQQPIIALTAHNDEDYRKNCLSAGFTSYFCKPLTLDAAKEMISAQPSAKDSL